MSWHRGGYRKPETFRRHLKKMRGRADRKWAVNTRIEFRGWRDACAVWRRSLRRATEFVPLIETLVRARVIEKVA